MKQIEHPSLTRLNGKPGNRDFIPCLPEISKTRLHGNWRFFRFEGFQPSRVEISPAECYQHRRAYWLRFRGRVRALR